jgi:hypothetical protein
MNGLEVRMEDSQAREHALYNVFLWRVLKHRQEEKEPDSAALAEREPDHHALVWTAAPLQAGRVCQLLAVETDVKAGIYEKPGIESFGYPVALVPCNPGRTQAVSAWQWIREVDSELISRAEKHFPPPTRVQAAPEEDHRVLFHTFFFAPRLARPTTQEMFRGIADHSIPVLGECFVCAPIGKDINPLVKEIGLKQGIHPDPEEIAAIYYDMTCDLVIWEAECGAEEENGAVPA